MAKLCLPAATSDANRKLAYANSICLLFLVVGLVGLKMPKPYVRPLPEVVDSAPVIFLPPDQPPPVQQDAPQDEPEESQDAALDAPVVATVVAPDASAVAFAVPVSGPVIMAASARFAAPPPPKPKAPPAQPTRFVPTGKEAGNYPWPTGRDYPAQALRQRQEGTVMLLVQVGEDGAPASVEVKDSSGYPILDRFALQWLKAKWQWPAGPARSYYVPFVFRAR